jgi:hypothetical protein
MHGSININLKKNEIVVRVLVCVCLLQTVRASLLRPSGDATEAERHQAADDEVMELH